MRLLCFVLFLAVFATPALAADLNTILAENARAQGGAGLTEIQSVRIALHIQEPTFEVDGVYAATREGRMRIDIYAGDQRVFAEGLMDGPEGACAWEWTPDKPESELFQCVGEKETAALRHGIELPGNFFTLQDVRERGATIELIGDVASGDEPEWHLRVTLPDGFARDYFVDQETSLISRARDYRAFHPGVDPTEINVETRYEEPQVVGGVTRFMRQVNVNVDTGEVLGTTTVLSVEHNPEISEGHFEPAFVPQER
jgi:hypothetical protein